MSETGSRTAWPIFQCYADVPPGPPFGECELERGHDGDHWIAPPKVDEHQPYMPRGATDHALLYCIVDKEPWPCEVREAKLRERAG